MSHPRIGLVGASTLAGAEILTSLEESEIDLSSFRLFQHEVIEGSLCTIRGEEIVVEECEESALEDVDILILACNHTLSASCLEFAKAQKKRVIDCTGVALQNDPEVPLLLPTLKSYNYNDKEGIVAMPGSGVAQLAPVLEAIESCIPIKNVVVTGLEPVSTAGQDALDELWQQGLSVYNQKDIELQAFQHQISHNVIPQVGVLRANGFTREEERLSSQCMTLLNKSYGFFSTTLVRVPVFYGLCQSVFASIEEEGVDIERIIEACEAYDCIEIMNNHGELPMPINVATSENIHLGRLRVISGKYVSFWTVADNIRRGVAEEAVLVLKDMISSATPH